MNFLYIYTILNINELINRLSTFICLKCRVFVHKINNLFNVIRVFLYERYK